MDGGLSVNSGSVTVIDGISVSGGGIVVTGGLS